MVMSTVYQHGVYALQDHTDLPTKIGKAERSNGMIMRSFFFFCCTISLLCLIMVKLSCLQVMQAAAKLGISITINQVGSDLPTTGTPATVSPIDRTKEWQPTFTLDEDGLLHQLRATLVQALDVSLRKLLHHYYCIHIF